MNKELKESAERLYPENWQSIMEGRHDSNSYERTAFIEGAKWQQERMYSEEDMREAIVKSALSNTDNMIERCNEIIEQFKKK